MASLPPFFVFLRLLLSYRLQSLLLQSDCRKWLRVLSRYWVIRMH